MNIFQLSDKQLILLAKNAWAFGNDFINSEFIVTHHNTIDHQRDGSSCISVRFEVENNHFTVIYHLYPNLNSSIGYFVPLSEGSKVMKHETSLGVRNQHYIFTLLTKWGVKPSDYSKHIVEEENPKNVVPNPKGANEIIFRVMYKTDKQFHKGMEVAVLDTETEGNWIARHSDSAFIRIPKQFSHLPTRGLSFDETDWELAGYENVNKRK